jgi:O-acetyl-ADP-ribose deacetylase (regulator of RNase III)
VYGYPVEPAARIAVRTTRETLDPSGSLEQVVFCCFSADDLGVYERVLAEPTA